MSRPRSTLWLELAVVILCTTVLFTIMLWSDRFADPDAFYHAKVALLTRDQGIVHEFPWLPYTELGQHYADQHFLYHLFLIPFVSFPDPLVGLKIATVVLAAGFFVTFFLVMRSLRLTGALPGTLALLLITPFTFRLALAKGNAFSLILLLLALFAMFHYRPRLLGLICFLYVWSYGGFPVALAAAAVFIVAALIGDAIAKRHHWSGILHRLFPHSPERQWQHRPHAVRLLQYSLIGVGAGLLINPFFPANLPFLYNQFIRIGIVNYRNLIGVGGEWYAYQPVELLANTIILTIPLLLAGLALLWTAKRQSRRSFALLLLAALVFLMTVKSRRYVEYYVPIGMFAVVSIFSDAVRGQRVGQLVRRTATRVSSRWRSLIPSMVFLTYVLIMLPTVDTRDLITEWRDLRGGFRADQYASALQWLRTNTERGDVVVHSDWDEFPILFYYNTWNRYIAGLDPTFLYTADPDRYWTWQKISTGTYDGSLVQGFRKLDARYALVDRQHGSMDRLMRTDPHFAVVYADQDATIYALQ